MRKSLTVNSQLPSNSVGDPLGGPQVKSTRGYRSALHVGQSSSVKTNSVFDEALRIAELVYPVLPCYRDKQPILRAWPKNATTDPAQIRYWFTYPDCLSTVKTGPDLVLFILGVDPNEMEWLAINEEKVLCEQVHETRRGKHFLYRFSDARRGVKTNTAGKIHFGIDTRGKGGSLIWWPAHGLGASGDLTDLSEPPSWRVDELVQSSGALWGHPTLASHQI